MVKNLYYELYCASAMSGHERKMEKNGTFQFFNKFSKKNENVMLSMDLNRI